MSAKHWTPAKKRFGPGKKALGPRQKSALTPAKKHLEYRPEPTSLRPRNRPEMMAPRRLECPEQAFSEFGSQRLAAQAQQRAKAGKRKPEQTADGIATIHTETFIGWRAFVRSSRAHNGGLQHRGQAEGEGNNC